MTSMENERAPQLYLVVGLGNFGATAALELAAQSHRVAVIDLDQKRVEECKRESAGLEPAPMGYG